MIKSMIMIKNQNFNLLNQAPFPLARIVPENFG